MKLSALVIAVVMTGLVACGPGEMGPPGVNGKDGSGLEKETTCRAQHTFAQTGQVLFEHVRYDFADGSAFVTCSITLPSGLVVNSSPVFYGQLDPGYLATSFCIVRYNFEGGSSFGQFEFTAAPKAQAGEVVYKVVAGPNKDTKVVTSCTQTG